MAAAAAFLSEDGFWVTVATVWPMSILLPNLTQISSLAIEIWLKTEFKIAAMPRHLEFPSNAIFGP